MDHELQLFIPILEILEIEVFNIIYKPGNVGNLSFSTSSYPGNIGKLIFFNFLTSWKYWIVRSIYQSYPGNIGSCDPYISPILEIVDRTIHISVLSWK